jgi:hypothetical protein
MVQCIAKSGIYAILQLFFYSQILLEKNQVVYGTGTQIRTKIPHCNWRSIYGRNGSRILCTEYGNAELLYHNAIGVHYFQYSVVQVLAEKTGNAVLLRELRRIVCFARHCIVAVRLSIPIPIKCGRRSGTKCGPEHGYYIRILFSEFCI